MPFVGVFEDLQGLRKFEGSGMATARGALWVVFDNLRSIGRIEEHFNFRGPTNVLVGELGTDSQFEAITYVESTGHFILMVEAYDDESHGFVPIAEEVEVLPDGRSYRVVQRCPVLFTLSHENKGFEGVYYHEDAAKGYAYLIGLCEGNFCSGGERGRVPGNGRLVVSELRPHEHHGDYDCEWQVKKVVDIPRAAFFQDYSDLAFKGNTVAITSQENSSVWFGTFDFEKLEFVADPTGRIGGVDGRMYHFPRDNLCQITYCNVEGVQWLDDTRLVIASDKAKRYQPYSCTMKDQLLSIFALPP